MENNMKKRKGILTLSSLVFLLAIATSGVFINEPINKQNLETAVAASNPASGASYYATNEGDKYYQGIDDNLEGEQLMIALSTLTSSGFVNQTYGNLPNIYQYSDVSNGKMVMIYTNSEASFSPGGLPSGVNKEHIWPASWYGNGSRTETAGSPGADAHNVQPCATELNSKRGSGAFDELNFSTSYKCYEFTRTDWSYGTPGDNNSYVWSTAQNNSNGQPGDALYPARGSRGRTARALLYVATRYKNNTTYPVKLHDQAVTLKSGRIGKLSTLLKWHFEEPPTEWEMMRNNEVATRWHHNRNPFVDHPEYAAKIYYTLPEPGASAPTAAVKNVIETYATASETIKLNKSSVEIAINDTVQINVSSNPNNETITWNSNNTQVATVSNNGLITGISKGTAIITASGSETSATCSVSVYDPDEVISITNLTLDQTSKSLKVGDDFKINATITPNDATNKTLDWSSSNTGVAVVDDGGRVTGVSIGNAIITAKTTDGSNKSATCNVAVTQASSGSGEWTLATNVSSFSSGDKIVMACNHLGFTAGSLSNKFLSNVASTFSGDFTTITNLGTGTMVFTLGGTSGSWTLANPNGELLGATKLKELAFDSGTTTWTIVIDSNGNATIQNTNSSYGRFLYNKASPRFTTYTSSANESMFLPQIYKMEELSSPFKTEAYDYASTFMTTTSMECVDLKVKLSTWNTLENSFSSLSDAAKNYICENFETDALIEAMIERYFFIVTKYGYENFIKNSEGTPLIVSGNKIVEFLQFERDYAVLIILLAVGVLLPASIIIGMKSHYDKKDKKVNKTK